MRLAVACGLILLLAPLHLFGQQGALTVSRGLDQLTQEAQVIVHGHVIATKVEPHPQLKNLTTVVVTLSVIDVLKGAPQKTLVFRQYLWDIAPNSGLPNTAKGRSYCFSWVRFRSMA